MFSSVANSLQDLSGPVLFPVRFSWPYGGSRVLLTGTFTRWSEHIPMSPLEDCSSVFQVVCHLTPGFHQYKFCVDGEWWHDENQRCVTGNYGIVNTLFVGRDSEPIQAMHSPGTPGSRMNMDVDNDHSRRLMSLHEVPSGCIFSHLPDVEGVIELPAAKPEMSAVDKDQGFSVQQLENGDDNATASEARNDVKVMVEPYEIPCMVEIFHFLCSLLNILEQIGISPRMNLTAFDEDVPLFGLGLINSAIELGGSSIGKQLKLLSLVQDELFRNLMQFGLSMSPLILSMVCSIVFNLYHQLCTELKLQIKAFFSCVIPRLAQSQILLPFCCWSLN